MYLVAQLEYYRGVSSQFQGVIVAVCILLSFAIHKQYFLNLVCQRKLHGRSAEIMDDKQFLVVLGHIPGGNRLIVFLL